MSLVPTAAGGIEIDREAVLRSFNLNPRDPKVQALILACERYGLDPLLKHAVLISGNLYVTRDGLLHVAHQDGRLDGIVVDEEGDNDTEWWARVTVYVKGQTHGYTYRGRYPKSGQQKKYGPEMAVKVAEVMALRRAFGVTGIATAEEQWDKQAEAESNGVAAPRPPLPHELEAGEAAVSADDPPPPEHITDAEVVDAKASKDERDTIRSLGDQLDDDGKRAVKAWRTANEVPAMSSPELTSSQARRFMDAIEAVLSGVDPDEPGSGGQSSRPDGEAVSPADDLSDVPPGSEHLPLKEVNPHAYQRRVARVHALGAELGLSHEDLSAELGKSMTVASVAEFTALVVSLQERAA